MTDILKKEEICTQRQTHAEGRHAHAENVM